MRRAALCYLSGALIALAVGPRPPVLPCALLALACLVHRRGRLCAALLCGFAWSGLAIDRAERALLPTALENQTIAVGARVAGFPLPGPGGISLELDDATARDARAVPRRLRVRWQMSGTAPRLGDWCELRLRLRRPHGYANPGGVDVERSALVNHVGATGMVVAHPANHCEHLATRRQVDGLRAWLARDMQAAVTDAAAGAVLRALAVDDRSGLSDAQWQTMRRTGTAHLIAISGLQITLAAGGGFVLCRWLCGALWARRQDYLVLRAAWFAACLAACAYTAIAGAGVPSARAAVMVVCAAAAALHGRRALGLDTLLASLVALVTWDPLALLGSGLWLSFGAVAVLVALASVRHADGPLALAWRTHLVMALALTPLTACLFGEVSWCAPLANLIAVPWSNVLVVPLVVLGMLCAGWAPAAAAILWDMAARLWSPLAVLLEALAALPVVTPPQALGVSGTLAASAGLALLWLPRAAPTRALGALLLASVALPRSPSLAPGEFRVVQFDVGQGLAVLVQTAHHALLFDAGPRWWQGGDAGQHLVLPALRAIGVRRLDVLVVSHGDLDHAGGVASVVAGMPVGLLLASEALPRDVRRVALPCGAPLAWRFDAVDFEFLGPLLGAPAATARNDRSCAMRVAGPHGSVLLSADIEAGAEAALLARHGARLASDVLLVPHHGSATSSTAAFVAAVRPRHALVSAARHNRYGLPRAEVLARYRALGARVSGSAEGGAITVDMRHGGPRVRTLRATHWGWWRRRPP